MRKRQPTDRERAILATLLHIDFPGSRTLRAQLASLKVAAIDEGGSLALYPEPDAATAMVVERVPVEATHLDVDGARIHLLVHVIDGHLSELEVYREDSNPIMGRIEAHQLELQASSPPVD